MARIMIVDDAAFMRMLLKTMLEEAGHDVIAEAAHGREAITKYIEHKPDIIMMDISMPVMDGIDSLKELFKLNPQVKVIMCSAIGQKSKVLDAVLSGAKDFIVKPVHKERVLAAINRQLDY